MFHYYYGRKQFKQWSFKLVSSFSNKKSSCKQLEETTNSKLAEQNTSTLPCIHFGLIQALKNILFCYFTTKISVLGELCIQLKILKVFPIHSVPQVVGKVK